MRSFWKIARMCVSTVRSARTSLRAIPAFGAALRHQREHLALACTQRGQVAAVADRGHDLVPALGQQPGETLAEQHRVLGDHDPHGTSTRTSVPSPAGLLIHSSAAGGGDAVAQRGDAEPLARAAQLQPQPADLDRQSCLDGHLAGAAQPARRSGPECQHPDRGVPRPQRDLRSPCLDGRGRAVQSTKAAATLDGIRNGSVDFASVADVVAAVQPGAGAPSGYGTAQLTRGKYLIASPIGDPPAFTGTVATELTVR